MKKQSNLKNILMTQGDVSVDLVLKPSMQVNIKAAGESARYEVSPLRRGQPSVAIAEICSQFRREYAATEHSDLAILKGLEEITGQYASGFPILQLMAAGWSLPVPADFQRSA